MGPSSVVFAQSFVPRIFDPIDPIDMKRLTSENFSFIPFKKGVMASPIVCTMPGEIIQPAANMAKGNNNSSSNGNNTNVTRSIEELVTAQVGIAKNTTGQELKDDMNLVVCMPSMTHEMMEMNSNHTGNIKGGMLTP